MKEKFLPVGSVVLLEGATKRLMITGFCTMDAANQSVMYDYSGCLYPEGMISSDETALFNHDQIIEVYHVGFSDEEEVSFKQKLNELINANSVVTESAPEALLTKTASEETPVPPIGPGLPGYVAPKVEEPKVEDIPPVGPGLPGYVAPKIEATPTAAPAAPTAAPAEITNIQFD